MPQLGEIKKASELGKKGYYNYVWHACIDCGKERWVLTKKAKTREPRSFRCCRCGSGKANSKGGRVEHGRRGYVGIRLYPEDFFFPMAYHNEKYGGYVLEHRLVMAKHLSRCLLPWEVVHHKNHIRNDNRLENLELITDRRFHLVDAITRNYIRRLESKIAMLEKQLEMD